MTCTACEKKLGTSSAMSTTVSILAMAVLAGCHRWAQHHGTRWRAGRMVCYRSEGAKISAVGNKCLTVIGNGVW